MRLQGSGQISCPGKRSDGYFAEYGSGNPGDFQNGILRFLIKEKRDGYGRGGEASAGRLERAF